MAQPNDFVVAWTNPPEGDRAPIVAAELQALPRRRRKLQPRAAGRAANLSRFGVAVPAPGEWTVSLWRRDAAGNETEAAASVPVTLRYDPEPPQLGFEPPPASDPTLVAVAVTDRVSGLASGSIEISRERLGHLAGARRRETDGQPAARPDRRRRAARRQLPAASARRRPGAQRGLDRPAARRPADGAHAAAADRVDDAGRRSSSTRIVRQTVRRHGKRGGSAAGSPCCKPAARVRLGGRAQVAGRLTNRDGQGIAGRGGAACTRARRSAPSSSSPCCTRTRDGRYRYTAAGSSIAHAAVRLRRLAARPARAGRGHAAGSRR